MRAIDDSKIKMTIQRRPAGPDPRPGFLGAVYKKGADSSSTRLTPYVDGFGYGPELADPPGSESIRITVPDVLGVGIASSRRISSRSSRTW